MTTQARRMDKHKWGREGVEFGRDIYEILYVNLYTINNALLIDYKNVLGLSLKMAV